MKKNGEISRREFIKHGTLSLGAAGLLGGCGIGNLIATEHGTGRKPNVLFILVDDQEKTEIECYNGKGKVLTPNMNRIAAEGVRFTNGYSTSPLCMPTRYTCLTGRYAGRCGHPDFLAQFPKGTQSEVMMNAYLEPENGLGHTLKKAGYQTGMVGKWHVTPTKGEHAPKYRPIERKADPKRKEVAEALEYNQKLLVEHVKKCGFDYAAGVYAWNVSDGSTPGVPFHNQEWVTASGLDFIEENKNRPFFLYFSTTLVHSPYKGSIETDPRLTPGGWLDKAPDVQPPRKTIAERIRQAGIDPDSNNVRHVTWLDDAVGALLDKLDELGIAEDTLVVYFSDQQRSGKGVCYEEGASTPFMLRWKGKIAPGVSDALVSNVDIVPTVFDVAGARPAENVRLDGKNLLPLALGKADPPNDAVFGELGSSRMVRTARYKYLAVRFTNEREKQITDGKIKAYMAAFPMMQKRAAERHPAYFDRDQLYDLQKDPKEKKNLAANPAHAAVLADMKKRLTAWLRTFPDRPFGEFTA